MSLHVKVLTVESIKRTVQGLKWRRLGDVLHIPSSKLHEIGKKYPTNQQCEAAVIRYWILHDPLASWRRLADQLYWHNEPDLANRICHYAEELTGNDTMCVYYNIITSVQLFLCNNYFTLSSTTIYISRCTYFSWQSIHLLWTSQFNCLVFLLSVVAFQMLRGQPI